MILSISAPGANMLKILALISFFFFSAAKNSRLSELKLSDDCPCISRGRRKRRVMVGVFITLLKSKANIDTIGSALLISSFVSTLVIINKAFVHHLHTPRSWIISCKVPISFMIRNRFMKTFNGLINDLHLGVDSFRS